MTGALSMQATLAARGLDLELTVEPGEHVAILGPNGAGKSTILGLVAGLLRADEGRAELDGRVLFHRKSAERALQVAEAADSRLGKSADRGTTRARSADFRGGVWVPPHARGVTLLAQDPLLFPHLSVLDNVAFAPRASGLSRSAAREVAERFLAEVDASEFAGRKPAQLSGGQAQRVAIARALAARPALILLDEPMAALDVAAAPMLRRVLRRVLTDRSALIVTHDVLDAVLLADRVLVVDGGRIVEQGRTEQVIAHPRTPFTAGIAGLNLISGVVTSATGLDDQHGVEVTGSPTEALELGGSALAVFSPKVVAVHADRPHGSPRNTFEVTITELEPRDAQVRVRAVDASGGTLLADVTAGAVGELDLHPGEVVFFAVKATAVTVYPS